MSPLGRQRSPHQTVWFLIVNNQTNRVAIVSSIITKKFNPCKYWKVTIQLFVKPLNNSVPVVYCQFYFLTFVFCCLIQCFVRFSALFDTVLCSIQCFVQFNVRLFSVFFCSDTGIVFLVFWSLPYFICNNHLAVNKHHTADSTIFVLV